jgi:hypothetical protein
VGDAPPARLEHGVIERLTALQAVQKLELLLERHRSKHGALRGDRDVIDDGFGTPTTSTGTAPRSRSPTTSPTETTPTDAANGSTTTPAGSDSPPNP